MGRGSGITEHPFPGCRKHQQYDCKWYVPLADLVFPSPEESEHCPQVHVIPDHELEDMKMKISAIKSEVQKEVRGGWGAWGSVGPAARVGALLWDKDGTWGCL